jgi:gluconokinase
MTIVIMGVAGAGKSTVGELLAAELRCGFLDGDSLHTQSNIEKMTHGIPLTDADRAPWLAANHARIVESFQRGECLVVACSALKQRYRETLADGVGITWVHLKGSEEVIRARLQHRQHHFMKAQRPPASSRIWKNPQMPLSSMLRSNRWWPFARS